MNYIYFLDFVIYKMKNNKQKKIEKIVKNSNCNLIPGK